MGILFLYYKSPIHFFDGTLIAHSCKFLKQFTEFIEHQSISSSD